MPRPYYSGVFLNTVSIIDIWVTFVEPLGVKSFVIHLLLGMRVFFLWPLTQCDTMCGANRFTMYERVASLSQHLSPARFNSIRFNAIPLLILYFLFWNSDDFFFLSQLSNLISLPFVFPLCIREGEEKNEKPQYFTMRLKYGYISWI